MFTPEATHKKTGCIAWKDFVAAMADAGCSMVQKGGSAVSFVHQGVKGIGTVSVHRPHPDSRINPILLKDIARKIEKYFRWTKVSFVERVKSVDP